MKKNPLLPILIVDDDPASLHKVEQFMVDQGYNNLITCRDSRTVLQFIKQHEPAVLLLDLQIMHFRAEEVLEWTRENFPLLPVVIMSAIAEVKTVVKWIKLGAYDFFVKSGEWNLLTVAVEQLVRARGLKTGENSLRSSPQQTKLQNPAVFRQIVTRNQRMLALFHYIEVAAAGRVPVLITGESGTGKELIAPVIHRLSGRPGKLITHNFAGIDDNSFSDTLFGHVKGAFTGADNQRKGLACLADNGTLFLDEIGDLSPASQVKLLRFIQNGEYLPLGSDIFSKTTARIIAATNRNLEKLVEQRLFREDLFHRLNGYRISLPPLRERIDDLPLLIKHFVNQQAGKAGRDCLYIPEVAITLLAGYSFPGNIRELENLLEVAVQYAFSMNQTLLPLEIIRCHMTRGKDDCSAMDNDIPKVDFPGKLPTREQIVEILFAEALKRCGNNQSMAARLIGLSRQAVQKRSRHFQKRNRN